MKRVKTISSTVAVLFLTGVTILPGAFAEMIVQGVSMEEAPPVSGGHSDRDLEVRIETALIQQAGVELTGVNVRARNGFVTLTGTVDSDRAKRIAAATALETGATGVRNLLTVGLP
jgi:osmotically-inducible protein OsmY